ncbi:putative ATP synthase D chain, mitochondrial [Ilyonectria robusta]
MATRSAALKLDWTKVTSSLGLRGQTVASLQAFKKRNEDARRKLQALSEQPTTVDFSAYRSVLKNQAVVEEIEKRFTAFKPVTYDVSRQLKAIDAFEAEAVKNAEATKQAVDLELKDLAATLQNIETARPFEDLTVVRPTMRQLFNAILTLFRTRLPLPRSRSTRRPLSSCPRADGWCRVTRAVAELGAAEHPPYDDDELLEIFDMIDTIPWGLWATIAWFEGCNYHWRFIRSAELVDIPERDHRGFRRLLSSVSVSIVLLP